MQSCYGKIVKGVLAVAALGGTLASPSDTWAAGGTGRVRITVLNVAINGETAWVRTDAGVYNFGDGCERQDDGLVLDGGGNTQRFERMLRILSAAHIANLPVSLWIQGCAVDSWQGWQRPRIAAIYVER